MHSSLRFFRYFVFGLFLLCSAVVATAAVWNLNLLQDAQFPSSSSPLQTDAYLVFVGCAGLALIFPVLFCELAQKSIFLVTVWFECVWVAVFCLMHLAGAAAASAAGSDSLCPSPLYWTSIFVDRSAICASSQVLQAFSWICGLLLLVYFVLFFMTTLLRRHEDGTIWRCNVRRFPWASAHQQLNTPISPTRVHMVEEKPLRKWSLRSGQRSFRIAAPRPFNAAANAVRRALLSYRSGPSIDLTADDHSKVESWRHSTFRISQAPVRDVVAEDPFERPLPPAPLPLAPKPPTMVTRQATAVTFGNSFYPQHMQSVLPAAPERQPSLPQAPEKAPSPSPLGEWPRMNPSAPKKKRKSNAVPPLVAAQVEVTRHQRLQSLPPLEVDMPALPERRRERQHTFPPVGSPPRTSSSRAARPLPTPDLESPSSRVKNVLRSPPTHPSSTSTTQPPPTSFSSRSRPSGPRRPSLEENQTSTPSASYNSRRNPRS